MRQLKIEGNTSLYIKHLCEVFFSCLRDTGTEFMKAFPEHYGCFSTFVVWSKNELQYFVSIFASQIFSNKTNFSIVADCVHGARKSCDQLSGIGLELTFSLDRLMTNDLTRLIQEVGDNRIEAVKLRHAESSWRPTNFGTPAQIASFEKEFEAMGIKDIGKYSHKVCFTHLSQHTIQFTRSHVQLCTDLGKLYTPEHHHLVTAAMVDIFKAQISVAEKSFAAQSSRKDMGYIVNNVQFLVLSLVPVIKESYEGVSGYSCRELDVFPAVLRKMQKQL